MEKCNMKRMEFFRLLLELLAWIDHQFLSGIRDSKKVGSLWGRMRGVGEVRKSIHQSWLAKGLWLGLGLLCWGFKGVQEEIPREEASTLQIESVAFHTEKYSKTHAYTQRKEKTVIETQNYSHARVLTHTHNCKISMRGKEEQSKFTHGKNGEQPQYKTRLSNQRSFKLQTRVSLSLIEYPINKALCHICSLTKATSLKHTHI